MQEKIANLEIKIFYDSAITKKKGRELSKPQCEQRIPWLCTDGSMQTSGVTEEVDAKGPASPSSPWRGGLVFPGQLSKRVVSGRTPTPPTEKSCLVFCKDRAHPLLAVKSLAPDHRGISSVHMAGLGHRMKPASSPTSLLSC